MHPLVFNLTSVRQSAVNIEPVHIVELLRLRLGESFIYSTLEWHNKNKPSQTADLILFYEQLFISVAFYRATKFYRSCI